MYVLGQLPQPGTPEFGQLAAYRRAILNGEIPSTESFEQYKADNPLPAFVEYQGPPVPRQVEPGTPAFGQRAAQRRTAIAATPIPATQGPGLLYYAEREAKAAGQAALGGLKIGTAALVIGAAVVLGFLVWGRR